VSTTGRSPLRPARFDFREERSLGRPRAVVGGDGRGDLGVATARVAPTLEGGEADEQAPERDQREARALGDEATKLPTREGG